MSIAQQTEAAISRWHEVVNSADAGAARQAVTDPVVVEGPKGAGPITPDGFADWITRSGIELRPRSYHPISDRVMVVEQDARWPQSVPDAGGAQWARVATMFRVSGDRVSAVLRFPDLHAALAFAATYAHLAATE